MEKAHIITYSVTNAKGGSFMTKKVYFVGLDIAAADFTASIYQSPKQPATTKEGFANTFDGFIMFGSWLESQKVHSSRCVICMEATGVYGEGIAYFLFTQGFRVSVEPPLKVKRAFDPVGHKTDPVDSRQIAEYAYRFRDELTLWRPKDEVIEKIRQLLAARELFTKQSVAIQNALGAYKKHVVQVSLINNAHDRILKELKKHIADIDKELAQLIRKNPTISQMNNQLKSLPGFGLLLSSNLIVLTGAFHDITAYRTLAAFLGICPYQHQSGTSVYKRPRIRHFGPAYARKLLTLAARSVVAHNSVFKTYYLRKLAEGKAKKLVLNNIANKLIKIACAVIKNNSRYVSTYRSVNPMCLISA
jgi:transposase